MLGAAPGTAQAAPTGASRASRVTRGTTLVHADLHNHTLLSDGMGEPELAHASLRAAGMDVAALTDHATDSGFTGLTTRKWRQLGQLTDEAEHSGVYTSLRGFEWSHSHLGHVNIWGTDDFLGSGGIETMQPVYDWLRESGGLASFNHPGRQRERFN
jgi:hypothetical protein